MGHELWFEQLAGDLPAGYGQDMTDFLDRVYGSGQIYPPRELVFAALDRTSLEAVRVVILGQDPYHGPGQAQGLAFSVPDHLPAPPSLRNILKELEADIGRRDHHDLTSWADQGVLLLNSCLTVPQHEPNGHAGLIWETLTDAIIRLVNRKRDPVVFILWGGPARKKKRLISSPQHLVLESAHPSPLSSYRGFFGSRSFSQTNAFLENQGLGTIDWLR